MAKIALIVMYDDMALGSRIIANALIQNGHEVSIIHFKLPASQSIQEYQESPSNYEYVNSKESHSEVIIHAINKDVNMWTVEEEHLLRHLLENLSPQIVGLSTRSIYEDCIAGILKLMKSVKGAITVAGGHGSNFEQELYLEYLDFVVIGEGEDTTVELANKIEKGASPFGIPNLVYKQNGKIIYNPLKCPSPSKDYFYVEGIEKVRHFVIENEQTLETDLFLKNITIPSYKENHYTNLDDYFTLVGWGCVDDCTFCSAGRFYKSYKDQGLTVPPRRMRNIASVMKELKKAKAAGYKQMKFIDSFFLAPKSYLYEFFDVYKREIGLPFFAQFYPRQILQSPDIIKRAYDAGLMHTVAGIQSGSEKVNMLIFKRDLPNEDVIKFGEILSSLGSLTFDYHLITHNPFESEEDFELVLDLVKHLPKRNAGLVLFRLNLVPRTEIYNMVKSGEGICEPDKTKLDKRALLYLIRYYAPNDTVFSMIREKSDIYSFAELKDAYRKMRMAYKDSQVFAMEGWQQYSSSHYEEAKESFNKAILLNDSNWKAYSGRGWSNLQEGAYPLAAEDFERALKDLKPFSSGKHGMQETYRGMAWAMFHQKRYAEATDNFRKSLEYTDSANESVTQDIYRGLGWSYYHLNKYEKGTDFFNKALENIKEKDSDEGRDALNGLTLIAKKGKFISRMAERLLKVTQ